MTEYEVASSALEQASGIREQVALTQAQLEIFLSGQDLLVQIVVGYLIVSYLVGQRLSTTQAYIMNALYLWWSFGSVLALTGTHDAGRFQYLELIAIDPDRGIPPFWAAETIYVMWGTWSTIILLSMWFFLEARRGRISPVSDAL
ncbi:MAG: hypothetical protein Cons2KO_01800 [Congregibacter sp.]